MPSIPFAENGATVFTRSFLTNMEEKLLNENAIDVLDRMIAKDNKVDLIATDPPYKVTTRGGYTNAGGMM